MAIRVPLQHGCFECCPQLHIRMHGSMLARLWRVFDSAGRVIIHLKTRMQLLILWQPILNQQGWHSIAAILH